MILSHFTPVTSPSPFLPSFFLRRFVLLSRQKRPRKRKTGRTKGKISRISPLDVANDTYTRVHPLNARGRVECTCASVRQENENRRGELLLDGQVFPSVKVPFSQKQRTLQSQTTWRSFLIRELRFRGDWNDWRESQVNIVTPLNTVLPRKWYIFSSFCCNRLVLGKVLLKKLYNVGGEWLLKLRCCLEIHFLFRFSQELWNLRNVQKFFYLNANYKIHKFCRYFFSFLLSSLIFVNILSENSDVIIILDSRLVDFKFIEEHKSWQLQ